MTKMLSEMNQQEFLDFCRGAQSVAMSIRKRKVSLDRARAKFEQRQGAAWKADTEGHGPLYYEVVVKGLDGEDSELTSMFVGIKLTLKAIEAEAKRRGM